MKVCPVCQAQLADEVTVCPRCSTPQGVPAGNPSPAPNPAQNPVPHAANPIPGVVPQQPVYGVQPTYIVYPDPTDHTAEFTQEDIHGHKVYAMLPYLLSLIGVIIALLAAKDSAYVRFHVKQALKILVTTALVGMLTVLLCWTIIAAIAGCVCLIILEVVNLIAFFQVCGNKAKEPPIVKSLSFLK